MGEELAIPRATELAHIAEARWASAKADAVVDVARRAQLSDEDIIPLLRQRADVWRKWGVLLGPAENHGPATVSDGHGSGNAERLRRRKARAIAAVPDEAGEVLAPPQGVRPAPGPGRDLPRVRSRWVPRGVRAVRIDGAAMSDIRDWSREGAEPELLHSLADLQGFSQFTECAPWPGALMAPIREVGSVTIAKGEDYYRKAAEEIVAAREADPQLSYRDVGAALGKSKKWAQQLVQWHTSGYRDSTPFGGAEIDAARQRSVTRKVARQNPKAIAEAIAEAPKEAQRKIAAEIGWSEAWVQKAVGLGSIRIAIRIVMRLRSATRIKRERRDIRSQIDPPTVGGFLDEAQRLTASPATGRVGTQANGAARANAGPVAAAQVRLARRPRERMRSARRPSTEEVAMGSFPTFEVYVEERGGWAGPGKCGGCLREAPRLSAGVERAGHLSEAGYCEWCLRYRYGYDQAEANTIRALIGGAVRGAAEAEIDLGMLRQALDAEIDREREHEARRYEKTLQRHGAAS